MKEYVIFVIVIILAVTITIVKFWPNKAQAAQENYLPVVKTDFGTVYLDTDSVQAVKKNESYYIVFTAEERYTDKEFLNTLRQGEDMQDVVATLYLYMFSNDGAYYWVPNHYLIDSQGKICVDLGSIKAQSVSGDAVLLKLYSSALKVMEDKKRLEGIKLR